MAGPPNSAERTESRDTQGTLLVVDDETNILAALARLFRREGYELLSASSGAEGLALLDEHDVGVIVSDQRMPDMNGIAFLSAARERRPDAVRIMLSGYTELSSVTDSVNKAAIYKFLTKPWDDEILREVVRRAFHLHEVTRENTRLTNALKEANASLTQLNHELERRVAEKTREATRNLRILRASQEILAQLPLPVFGVDTDGYLVLVNRAAETQFGVSAARLGDLASAVLPTAFSNGTAAGGHAFQLDDGRAVECWRLPMLSDGVETGTAWVIHRLDGRMPA